MAAVQLVADEQQATFTLTDGDHTATLEFTYRTPEEYRLACEKMGRLQDLVDEFSAHLRLVARQEAPAYTP